MSSKSARAARKALWLTELAQKAESTEASAEFERLEQQELVLETDEVLGAMVDYLTVVRRSAARAEGERTRQVYAILKYTETNIPVVTSVGMKPWSQKRTAEQVAVSEVALALNIPERTAHGYLEDARMLVEELPATIAGLSNGDLSYRFAQAIVSHARSLPEDQRSGFEETVLPYASKWVFSKFAQKLRTVRERMDPTTITARHQKSLADRETFFEPAQDGMGWLHLYSSASVTLGAFNRADEIARAGQNPLETRTLTQLRADTVADLLLDGRVGDAPEYQIRPSVAVTVPVLTMLGHKNADGDLELPVLEGYGPIDIATATRLAGAAKSWLRVLTHPETGVSLSVGRDKYRPPAALRNYLQRVDGTCRKPGCTRPAVKCDLDHTAEWQHGGQTAHDNLAHYCKKHHTEKHHTSAKITRLPGGDIEWTLTSGHSYVSEPTNRATMRPAKPLGSSGGQPRTNAA
ncbi:MAG TPA: DUF222 domain-containing protein [Galbitalea sp.]|nr:DUF222 domain-containing protein [Galbitalea sp.]